MHETSRSDHQVIRALGQAAPLGRLPEFVPQVTTDSLLTAAMRSALLTRNCGKDSLNPLGIADPELAEFIGPVVVADPARLPDWAETLIELIDWWQVHSDPTWISAIQWKVDDTVNAVNTHLSRDARQSLIAQALSSGVPPENPRDLLIEAPARAYAVGLRITRTLSNFIEFVERLEKDSELVCELIGAPCASIADLTMDCGDPHNGQRSVMIVTFDSGAKVVYKTKNLKVQILWNSILELINPVIHEEFAFRGPQAIPLIARDNYAWVKYLEQSPAQEDSEAVHRFMVRMGCLSLVASRLRANDLWGDNLITQNDQPYIIDVETLLQPVVDFSIDAPHLHTGLVSLRSSPHPDLPATELGALTYSKNIISGMEATSNSSQRGSGFDAVIDADKQGRSWVSIVMDERRPTLQGEPPHLIDWFDSFAEGYRSASRALSRESSRLTALVFEHSADVSRVIIQGTFDYYRAMNSSWLPQYCRDTRARTLALMRTVNNWHGGRYLESPSIAWEEAVALADGDIPYFTSRADSVALFNGDIALGDIAVLSGMESITSHIDSIDNTEQELTEIYAQVSSDLLDGETFRSRQASTTSLHAAGMSAMKSHKEFRKHASDLVDFIEEWRADPRHRGVVEEPRSAMRIVGPVPFDVWNGGAAAALLLVEAGRDPHGIMLAQAIEFDLEQFTRWQSPLRGPWLSPVSGILVGLMAGLPAPYRAAQNSAVELARLAPSLFPDHAVSPNHGQDGLGDRVWSQTVLAQAGCITGVIAQPAPMTTEPYWGLLPTTQVRRRMVAEANPHTLSSAELIALGEIPGRADEAAHLLCRNHSESGRWLGDRLADDRLLLSGIWGLVGVARTLLRASGQSIPSFRDPLPPPSG